VAAVVDSVGSTVGGCAAVVNGDVAGDGGSGGCKEKGCGVGWGAVCWLGRECRRFRGAGGSFGAGEEVLVVVVGVDSGDGGCAGVVSNDVADCSGVDRLVVVWVLALT
jgi:hypothetical protein